VARYGIDFAKTSGAAAGLIVQLRAGAARDIRLYEVGIFSTTAAAGTIQLIRPSAVGATFTSVGPGLTQDPIAGAGVALVDTAATTPPTIGTVGFRRISLAANVGGGVIWTYTAGIAIPVSGSIALWQLSALAVGYAGYFDYEE